MFDGGGVEADVKVKLPKPSALEIALQVSGPLVVLLCFCRFVAIIITTVISMIMSSAWLLPLFLPP